MDIYDSQWAENYERLANAGIPGREGLYRICRVIFAEHLPSRPRILVIGCGTGEDLFPLAEAIPKASFVAIEPAEAMFAYCKSRLERSELSDRVVLYNTDLAGLDCSKGSFSAATAILVSQHIALESDASMFFRKIADSLADGGFLYSADINIPAGLDRDWLLDLWKKQSLYSGIEKEVVNMTFTKFYGELMPRDESQIESLIGTAGFEKPKRIFQSLIYSAWIASKQPGQQGIQDGRSQSSAS